MQSSILEIAVMGIAIYEKGKGKDVDLKSVSTKDLLAELITRSDLLDKNGYSVEPEGYALSLMLSPQPCADLLIYRVRGRVVEAAAGRRNSEGGKWAFPSGGRITLGTSLPDMLQKHMQSDLGADVVFPEEWPWYRPATVFQYRTEGPATEDWGHDRTKYAVGTVHPVMAPDDKFIFGKTIHGGQEIKKVAWFSLSTMPPPDAWAFGHDVPFRRALQAVHQENLRP
jgi:hypothetical protein